VRWRFFISEAVNSIRGNVATTIAARVTVLIVTFLLAVFASLGLFLYDKTVGVRNDITVKVYMKMGTESDTATLNRIHNQLAEMPYVKSVTYVSPEDAIHTLTKDAQKDAQVLPNNPLPPAFYVKLTDPSKAGAVSASAGQIDGVKDCGSPPCVTYGKEIADKVLTVTKWVLVFLGSLMALLGIAAVVLIANTIRLSIFSRRREIEVMKLVGATNWFVRVPFVLEGMLT
jgi:cell division transport system permease protein